MMKSLLVAVVAICFSVPQSFAEQRLERSGPERSGPERSVRPDNGVQRQEQRRDSGQQQRLDTRSRQDVVREKRQETTTPRRETRPNQEIRQERRQQETTTTTKQQLTTTPNNRGLRAVSGNQGRVVIKGQNYTVWKGAHRVRVGDRFRRFGPLALAAIVVSGVSYYPYAYLSAPEPVCAGVTEDGFVLRWVEVQTLEGDRVYQCVAFAPR